MIESILAAAALYFLYCYCAVKHLSRPSKVSDSTTATVPSNITDYPKNKLHVPEDVVLKRHFITHLRSEIEAGLAPRPSDSILQRHHETLVMGKLDRCLTELGRLTPC